MLSASNHKTQTSRARWRKYAADVKEALILE